MSMETKASKFGVPPLANCAEDVTHTHSLPSRPVSYVRCHPLLTGEETEAQRGKLLAKGRAGI